MSVGGASPNVHLGKRGLKDEDDKDDGKQSKENDDTATTTVPAEHIVKRRKLCELGTGEMVHILSYKALPDKIQEFEVIIQSLAHKIYQMKSAVTDVRVCHPCCGEVFFIMTFLSKDDLNCWLEGPQKEANETLAGLIENNKPSLITSGCLMPACHTLHSLLEYLEKNVVGASHTDHDTMAVKRELAKWHPRASEVEKYVNWDPDNPTKYTRNLILGNENMDVILMCWPSGSVSTIHDHDQSSCWVMMVEGSVNEVQYAMPQVDRKFIETEWANPTGATGRCGKLKVINVATLEAGGITATYANNDIGLHRIENRSPHPAYTLHVYAPPLTKMKIFKESGEVHVHSVSAKSDCASPGTCGYKLFDIAAWNTHRCTEGGENDGGCKAALSSN